MNIFLTILISLLITAFVYLLFPVVYVLTKGKIQRKKAIKFAIINSVIGAVIFIIVRVIIGEDPIGYSNVPFLPAIFYGSIAEAILCDKNLKEKKNNNDFINNSNDDNKTTKENKKKKEEEETVDWINMK